CQQRADAADRAFMELADGAVLARLVRICAAVPVDACDGKARNEYLEISDHHGRIHVCACVCGVVHHLSHRLAILMPQLIDRMLVGLVLLMSAAYALFALGPKALRSRMAAS